MTDSINTQRPITFTDLKQQREKELKKSTDYQETAQEQGDEQTEKKKKKKKRNKKKK